MNDAETKKRELEWMCQSLDAEKAIAEILNGLSGRALAHTLFWMEETVHRLRSTPTDATEVCVPHDEVAPQTLGEYFSSVYAAPVTFKRK